MATRAAASNRLPAPRVPRAPRIQFCTDEYAKTTCCVLHAGEWRLEAQRLAGVKEQQRADRLAAARAGRVSTVRAWLLPQLHMCSCCADGLCICIGTPRHLSVDGLGHTCSIIVENPMPPPHAPVMQDPVPLEPAPAGPLTAMERERQVRMATNQEKLALIMSGGGGIGGGGPAGGSGSADLMEGPASPALRAGAMQAAAVQAGQAASEPHTPASATMATAVTFKGRGGKGKGKKRGRHAAVAGDASPSAAEANLVAQTAGAALGGLVVAGAAKQEDVPAAVEEDCTGGVMTAGADGAMTAGTELLVGAGASQPQGTGRSKKKKV